MFVRCEQEYCDAAANPARHYAGRFAVKEAVAKAFGTGIGPHLGLLDIEVIRHPDSGAPSVRLIGKARELARRRKVTDIQVSLSHTHSLAIAHAILLGAAPGKAERRLRSAARGIGSRKRPMTHDERPL